MSNQRHEDILELAKWIDEKANPDKYDSPQDQIECLLHLAASLKGIVYARILRGKDQAIKDAFLISMEDYFKKVFDETFSINVEESHGRRNTPN